MTKGFTAVLPVKIGTQNPEIMHEVADIDDFSKFKEHFASQITFMVELLYDFCLRRYHS